MPVWTQDDAIRHRKVPRIWKGGFGPSTKAGLKDCQLHRQLHAYIQLNTTGQACQPCVAGPKQSSRVSQDLNGTVESRELSKILVRVGGVQRPCTYSLAAARCNWQAFDHACFRQYCFLNPPRFYVYGTVNPNIAKPSPTLSPLLTTSPPPKSNAPKHSQTTAPTAPSPAVTPSPTRVPT